MKKTMKRLQLIFAAILLMTIAAMATEPSKVIVKYQDKKYYVHTVADGDTLYSLSKTYGVSQEIIIRVNGMESADIVLGTKVYVPCIEGRVMQDNEGAEEATEGKHVVSAGETLYSLSRKYGMTEEQLLEMNGLKSHTDIKAGMTLKVRMNKSSNAKAKSDGDARNGTASSRKQNDGNMYQGSDERASAESLKAANISQELADAKQVADSAVPEPALEEDALFAVVAPSTVLQVTLVLPFHVKGEVKENMVDFYRGVLLGFEDLKAKGRSVELSVLDSKRSLTVINELIENGEFDTQLIIGPVYGDEFAPLLKHAEDNGIPVVSPLQYVESDSHVLFNMPPMKSLRGAPIAGLVDGSRKVVTIYASQNDNSFISEVRSVATHNVELPLNFKFDRGSYFYKRNSDGSNGVQVNIEDLMRDKDSKVFIIMASTATDVDRILTTLSSTKSSIRGRGLAYGDYMVVGNSEWLKMGSIDRDVFFHNDVVFVVPYYANRIEDKVRIFDGRFVTNYNAMPSRSAYRGYDAAVIFGSMMFEGIDRFLDKTHMPLVTPYTFKRVNGSYVNTNWVRQHYRHDSKIIVD
jgi:LysM repeat protein